MGTATYKTCRACGEEFENEDLVRAHEEEHVNA